MFVDVGLTLRAKKGGGRLDGGLPLSWEYCGALETMERVETFVGGSARHLAV